MDFDNPESNKPYKQESINIEEWVKFISYYRYYIDEFASEVLGIKLHPFQRFILRCMARYNELMFIASRGLGKSFLSAVFLICASILYPGIKCGIASGKGQQARNVIIQKIQGELYNNENVAREIVRITTGKEDTCVYFKNGSEIRAIVLGQEGENARSWRFNYLLVDEARIVPDQVIEKILIPMTKTKRPQIIQLAMKFGNKIPIEKGKVIYISSAYLKTCDLYKRFLMHYKKMLTDSRDYFVCTLPYQIGVQAQLFYEDDILKEKEKPSMTSDIFSYEYEGIFVGSSNESYYPYELTEGCRTLSRCETQQPKKATNSYIISHDVAISDASGSDNAVTSVIKLKEKTNGAFNKELIYMKSHNGMTLPQQRDYLRELLIKFPNTEKLVIDVRGNGQALPSLFDETWEYINDKGEVVECPPLVPDDDEERMQIDGAVPLIRTVAASNASNNSMYTYLRSCFENGSIKLLIPSAEVDMEYKSESITQEEFEAFVNIDLLIQELSNIKQDISGFNNTIYERIVKATKRDRVTSLAYGMDYIREVEEERKRNIRVDDGTEASDYLLIN